MTIVLRPLPAVVACLVIMAPTSGWAADAARPQPEPAPVTAISPGWTFQATAYGWLAGVTGDMGVHHLPPAHLNVTPLDVLKNLDGALMGSFLARNGDWTFMTDLIWARLSDKASIRSTGDQVTFTQTQVTASGLVGYKLPLGLPENINLSATVGFRYQYLRAKLGFSPAAYPLTISRSGSEGWIDPTVGLSLNYKINDKWFVNFIGDVGGFGVSSDFTTQGFVSVGYMWTPEISTAIGYRAIYTNYKNGGFVYDATQHGVFTSLAYHF